ncbi:MAG TPA: cyanophycinase [Planctomycetota bacterium]|nr:cyanophycinase [Planctomycetota bacterium]
MRVTVLLAILCCSLHAFQAPTEPAEKIPGALVIHGGGRLDAQVLDAFVKIAGGENARLLIIPTAAEDKEIKPEEESVRPLKEKFTVASIAQLHTRSREQANDAAFCEPLRTATGVWFGGGLQQRLEEAYVGTQVERELHALLARGGVIGGTSAGAAVMSKLMIRRGNPKAELGTGFGFLPHAVVDQHFLKRERKARLLEVLDNHPGLYGLGIDEDTALIVSGRNMIVLGSSTVSVCFRASENRAQRIDELRARDPADLIALSRAALARTQPAFPPKTLPPPEVAGKGTLIIDGGGCPTSVVKKFVEAAGGPDALIVIIPTALDETLPPRIFDTELLERGGAKNLRVLHAKNRAEASEPAFLEKLREAKGIWFTGGRQWRLVDAYLGTPAEKLMHEILQNGGAIGGSSAGATIQGEYLVRGNPLGNREMMSEGYERGLAFLKGVAIDQHFIKRDRFADMSALKKTFPQLLGLGIDEGAAVLVRGQSLEVIGRASVAIYDRSEPAPQGQKEYLLLAPGEKYDLSTLKKKE